MRNNPLDVLGVGSPFVDYIIEVDYSFMENLTGEKGGMVLVDYPTLCKIIAKSKNTPVISSGGSCANTIKGLARLGQNSGIIGKIGNDEAGQVFFNAMRDCNVSSFLIQIKNLNTAQAICLITPDSERTMRSYLGAAQEMSAEDLDPALFEGVRLIHLEGYTVLKEGLAERAMELAKQAGAKISFDLGSFEVVNANREKILKLLTKYVDIVFANRDEIQALTKLPPKKGGIALAKLCEIGVVLLGAEGCIVNKGNEQEYVPAISVNAIDSTGAGDLFASGFLHGYLNGLSIMDCGRYGNFVGAAVVQVRGAEIPLKNWQEIQANLAK